MTSVRRQGRPIQRGQVFKALTDLLSSNGDHEKPLGSNEPGPSKAPAGSKAPARPETPAGPEAPPGTPQTPSLLILQDLVANRYSQRDLDRIIQTFFYASKGGCGDKLKAKTSDVYCGRSHIECYNFCQQCEDHFTTYISTKPNRVPFAASFLQDRINFRWQQHKQKLEAESSVLISWDEFKAFLRKALGDSRAFVDSYWTKIKWDSQYQ